MYVCILPFFAFNYMSKYKKLTKIHLLAISRIIIHWNYPN